MRANFALLIHVRETCIVRTALNNIIILEQEHEMFVTLCVFYFSLFPLSAFYIS